MVELGNEFFVDRSAEDSGAAEEEEDPEFELVLAAGDKDMQFLAGRFFCWIRSFAAPWNGE